MMEKKNVVKIAKVVWISRKNSGTVYRSMVVYMAKDNEAARLLQGQYFHIAGESL